MVRGHMAGARLPSRNARHALLRIGTQRAWTTFSSLREITVRDATLPEDRVYGLMGILGIRPTPGAIQYNIGDQAALRVLLQAMYIDQRLLLTV